MRIKGFNRIDYLNNRKLQILKRASNPLQIKLQIINNNAIDHKILELSGEPNTDEIIPAYNESKLISEINAANLVANDKLIRRLLRNSIASSNEINKLLAKNANAKVSDRLTKVEVERIQKNLKYVEATLDTAEVDIQMYKSLMDKLPSTISRQDMLQKALTNGENYKGRKYSYKELSKLSRDLEKYKNNHLQYEVAKIENTQAQQEGLDSVNSTKTWVWSTLEKTRHEELDGQTVPLYSKFEVINSQTGDVDYLRFPGDIENDHNNCSNICNCQCSYIIE